MAHLRASSDAAAMARKPELAEELSKKEESNISEEEFNFHKMQEALRKQGKKSLLKKSNLNFTFAATGTALMAFKSFISFFIKDDVLKDNSKTSGLKRLGDFCHRLREVCQYSIYAQPGENISKPDDVAMDYVDDIDSTVLGRKVYNLNAFVSPWVGLFKAFFPYSTKGLLGLPTRLAQTFDDLNTITTNTFWNFRKIVWSLVPYDGPVLSKNLYEKQNHVKDIYTFVNNRIRSSLSDLWNVFVKADRNHTYSNIIYEQENQRIKRLVSNLFKGYSEKIKTFLSTEYTVHKPSGAFVIKKVGQEEPENHWLYIRSKLFSQIISLPVGIVSAALNYGGMVASVLGNVFNHESSQKIATKLTNYSQGLISLSYITGEVPANINEFWKKQNSKKHSDFRNLLCAGFGAIGMLNKIKVLPIFSSLLKAFKIKPLLDKCDREFDNFFYLFFSFNRFILHHTQKQDLQQIASNRDIEEVSSKFDNWWKFASLPFRVILQDRNVSYFKDDSSDVIDKASAIESY